MKVLLAVDEEPGSEETVSKVGNRRWEEGTVVRVLHAVGKFVPPAQELWYDAGGDPGQARQEVKDRSTELTERVGGWLREQGLTVETTVRDGEAGAVVVEEAKMWGQTSLLWARAVTPASGGCSKGASHSTWLATLPAPSRSSTPRIPGEKKMAEKKRVLILCTGNSARSQMAEGLLRHEGGRFEVESAGVNPSRVRPEAVEAMSEIGVDISSHRSKSADEYVGQEFDYIITVCDNARELPHLPRPRRAHPPQLRGPSCFGRGRS